MIEIGGMQIVHIVLEEEGPTYWLGLLPKKLFHITSLLLLLSSTLLLNIMLGKPYHLCARGEVEHLLVGHKALIWLTRWVGIVVLLPDGTSE